MYGWNNNEALYLSHIKDILNMKGFTDEVKDEFRYALHVVQEGATPSSAKILKGFNPAVVEIVSNYNTDTFRTVYTVKLEHEVYVLHCFQKKSKTGIKSPKQDIDLIKRRLNEAKEICRQ